ncbi:MAG: metal-sulfur cluster assembly factor [Candidatus Anammoxibacter sp.]
MVTEPIVRAMLMGVLDPELEVSIVDLGLIYAIKISGNRIDIDMTLTTPACPLAAELMADIKKVLKGFDGITDVEINLVWSPPWTPDMMTDEAKEIMAGYYPSFKIE